jgi:hypothetical protein
VRFEVELDKEASVRLIERAIAERRPVPWQAEVLIRQALGLSIPSPEQRSDVRQAEEPSPAGPDQAGVHS